MYTDRKKGSGFHKYVTAEFLTKTTVRKSICKSKNFHIVSPCSAANCIYYVTRSIGWAVVECAEMKAVGAVVRVRGGTSTVS